MTSYVLDIAGIKISICHPGFIEIRENNPAYDSFFKRQNSGKEMADVLVALEYGRIPDTKGMTMIFDSDQSWSIYKDHNNYCLKLYTSSPERPILEAIMNSNFTDMYVYCGDEFISMNNGQEVFINPIRYPLDQLLLTYVLSRDQGAILHAAGNTINDKGFLFIGRPGQGKHALSELILESDLAKPLSDNRIVVRKIGRDFEVFGTPWPGEAAVAENKSCRLNGMFFLDHGSVNSIKKVTPKETIEKLKQTTSIPWYDEKLKKDILYFCKDLSMRIPAYEFYCTSDDNAVEYLEAFLSS
jgi:hypothetical protein